MKNLKNEKGIGLTLFILIFVGILVIAGAIVGGVIISKNLNKEPISVKAFKEKMEYKDFEIQDILEQFEGENYIKKACIALEEDYEYQIEFYKLDEEEDAINFYNSKKEPLENSEVSTSSKKERNMGNNSKYIVVTGEKYKVVSRIENTVIYADVDLKYQDKVEELLKEIGY